MYTALVIGAAVLIVIALTYGIAALLVFLADDGVEKGRTVEPPHVIPQHGPYDWETLDGYERSPDRAGT